MMIQRRNPPHAGAWSVPGGKQRLGETLRAAARREVREETGLKAETLQILDAGDIIEEESEGRVLYHYTLVYFVAPFPGGSPRAGDDATALRWFTLEEGKEAGISAQLRKLMERALTVA